MASIGIFIPSMIVSLLIVFPGSSFATSSLIPESAPHYRDDATFPERKIPQELIEFAGAPEEQEPELGPELGDDEIPEFGKIIDIEDNGYPMFSVTVSFPERNFEASFSLNIEAIDLQIDQLHPMLENYATLFYVSESRNDLFELQYEGQSLFGEYALQIDPEWKQMAGILSGADAATAGDLPDEILVVDEKGNEVHFDFFITPEMVAKNGRSVIAYYQPRYVNEITHLQASHD